MSQIASTLVVTALIAAATLQTAAAAERHHLRRTEPVPASQQFRNSNNAVIGAPATQQAPGWNYSGWSAPAGH